MTNHRSFSGTMTNSLSRLSDMTRLSTLSRRSLSTALSIVPLALVGCAIGTTSFTPNSSAVLATSKATVQGSVHGGQQPVVGASIYLYAVGTSGYGSASTSLLTANGNSYVSTDSNGNFSISGDYNCPSSSSLVYLLATGGNSGSGNNSQLALMAALGNCNTLKANASTAFINIDEVTTVASAYALAPFFSSATAIGAPASNLTGITNAFAEVANLANVATGVAYQSTVGGNGTVPQQLINSLANAIALCVNTSGAVTGGNTTGCDQLYTLTTVGGSVPTSTVAASMAIAKNPARNVAEIIHLGSATPPFLPALTSAPNDLTLSVAYTGNGISTPGPLAVDASGNIWVANATNNIIELAAATGSALSGTTGFTSGSLDVPTALAIDGLGNVWVTSCGATCSDSTNGSSVTVYTPGSGNTVSAISLTGGGLAAPYGIAIDGSNRAWITNSGGSGVSLFTTSGPSNSYTSTFQASSNSVAIDASGNVYTTSPASNAVAQFTSTGAAGTFGYQGTGLAYPTAIAVDASNRPWIVNHSTGTVSVLNAGLPAVGSPLTGGGLSAPNSVALDGAGSAWVSNSNGSISAFTSAGAAVTGSAGFAPGAAFATGVAVDAAGSVWVSNCGAYCTGSGSDPGSIYQVIGVATPVVTPIQVGGLATKP